MQAINPNIRWGQPPGTPQVLPEPQQHFIMNGDGETEPHFDQDTGAIEVKLPDGSIRVDLDPKFEDEDEGDKSFDANLALKMDVSALGVLAEDLLRGIDADNQSRQSWLEMRAKGIDLLGLQLKQARSDATQSTAPLEGMAQIDHPLLLEACLRFQANARGELLPAEGPVKVENDDERTPLSDHMSDLVEDRYNHYLTSTASEYYPDTDRMLLLLGYGGMMFKKVYKCPLRRRPVSESVDAKDLIVNNTATDLQNASRITHEIRMRKSVMRRMQLLGVYRDVDLGQPIVTDRPNAVDAKIAKTSGIDPMPKLPEDGDYTIYECYAEIDLPGHEHKENGETTGLALPYRVTIEKTSRQILEIKRNWKEDDEDFKAKRVFVPYVFVPGLGFYGIGLVNILGNTTRAASAAWRLYLDACQFGNFPGFVYKRSGARQMTNTFRVPPGGGVPIDGDGMSSIRDLVMPLPYKEPGPVAIQFIDNMVQTGQRVGGTAEMQIGEGRQDAPVGTTLALIEQAAKIMDAVHKRLHQAQAEEFELLTELFMEDPDALFMGQKRPNNPPFYKEIVIWALKNLNFVPAADPNTSSHIQRLAKVQAALQLAGQFPQYHNVKPMLEWAYGMMRIDGAAAFLVDPQPQQQQVDPIKQGMLDVARQKNMLGFAQLQGKMQSDAEDRKSKSNQGIWQLAKELAVHPDAANLSFSTLNRYGAEGPSAVQ